MRTITTKPPREGEMGEKYKENWARTIITHKFLTHTRARNKGIAFLRNPGNKQTGRRGR